MVCLHTWKCFFVRSQPVVLFCGDGGRGEHPLTSLTCLHNFFVCHILLRTPIVHCASNTKLVQKYRCSGFFYNPRRQTYKKVLVSLVSPELLCSWVYNLWQTTQNTVLKKTVVVAQQFCFCNLSTKKCSHNWQNNTRCTQIWRVGAVVSKTPTQNWDENQRLKAQNDEIHFVLLFKKTNSTKRVSNSVKQTPISKPPKFYFQNSANRSNFILWQFFFANSLFWALYRPRVLIWLLLNQATKPFREQFVLRHTENVFKMLQIDKNNKIINSQHKMFILVPLQPQAWNFWLFF